MSIARSTRGPTASRTAATRSTIQATSAAEACQFQGSVRKPARVSSTSNLIASKPSATTSLARRAYDSGEKSLPAWLSQ